MTEQTNVKLKLMIDSKSQSVLYGEAKKDFIDFLLNLLSLPLGAVIRVLKKENMVGCLGNLYESVETLSDTCFLPNQTKDTILKPQVSFNCPTKLLPYVIETSSIKSTSTSTSTSSDVCSSTPSSCCDSSPVQSSTPSFSGFASVNPLQFGSPPSSGGFAGMSSSPFGSSPSSGGFGFAGGRVNTSLFQPSTPSFGGISPLRRESTSVKSSSQKASTSSGGEKVVGYVKGLATYIVMDDLTVKQISDFSLVSLFKKFNIKDVDSLEEKVVTLNVDEGVELLKASLQSKMVLTDVFLRREREIIDNNDNNFSMDSQLN